MQAVDLPLRPSPSPEWDAEWAELMRADPWLAKKVNREQRLREHWRYVQQWLPEIKVMDGALLDIGPGMGELLEIAEHFGCEAAGLDAECGEGGMGDGYHRAACLMLDRQFLTIVRSGDSLGTLTAQSVLHPGAYSAINARGSVEQIFSRYMLGVPHHVHQDCKQLRWDMPRAAPKIDAFMDACQRLLRPGGVLMIHANGCATEGPGNIHEYDAAILMSAARAGLEVVKRFPPVIHKWRKP